MNNNLRNWFNPLFSHPERLNLWTCLALVMLAIRYFGALLTPVLLSLVIAYLLHWPVMFLQRYLRLSYFGSALVTYFSFLGLVMSLCVLIMPLIVRQLHNLLTQLPELTARSQDVLADLQHRYPGYISSEQIQNLTHDLTQFMTYSTQWILSSLITSIPDLMALSVYLVLVPLLVYFLLTDQHKILAWLAEFLPRRRRLIIEVWTEVYTKTGHYVRGKALEILIVWIISAIIFTGMRLPYAMLLGLLTGLSAAVPYIGTVVVAIPVTAVGFLEWGLNQELFYLLIIYSIINFLDSHLLFPFLFAEAVSLHPIAIMIATLFFGGLLGFWGVFLSIPLAVLSNSVFNTFKRSQVYDATFEEEPLE